MNNCRLVSKTAGSLLRNKGTMLVIIAMRMAMKQLAADPFIFTV